MKLRVHLIMGLVRLLSIPGALRRRMTGAPDPGQLPHIGGQTTLLYRRDGEIVEFASFTLYPDRVTERFGTAGLPAPGRTQNSNTPDALIADQISELEFDDYALADSFPGQSTLTLTAPTLQGAEICNALQAVVEAAGLGTLSGNSAGAQLRTPIPDTAPAILTEAMPSLQITTA
ncbi:hypothetical protein IV417_00805 [Alphaproteobacteria bacterium KMM 3653]|uniref:Uncharacterized protein n=1 Tax=Harenicola maris TaxID=2841044 RepID=A0AAP2CLW3_9RHOB|nr:hypothetical protein [Harenicola maris]